MEAQKHDIKKQLVAEELEFEMDQETRGEKIKVIADVNSQVEEDEIAYKDVQQKWREKIKKKKVEVAASLQEIKEGCVKKTVNCEEQKNYTTKKVSYWVDGVCKKTRDMTEDDRQEKLIADDASKVTPITPAK